MIFHKKTQKQKALMHWSFILIGICALVCVILYMFNMSSKVADPNSIDFESVVQLKLMFGRFKAALGFTALGGVISYILATVFANSPLGSAAVAWDEKDNDAIRSSKTRNLGLVYSAFVIGVFIMLATIIGK